MNQHKKSDSFISDTRHKYLGTSSLGREWDYEEVGFILYASPLIIHTKYAFLFIGNIYPGIIYIRPG